MSKHLLVDQRLEEYDYLRTATLLNSYVNENACKLSVKLPGHPILIGAFVDFRLEISAKNVDMLISSSTESQISLFALGVDWPNGSSKYSSHGISITSIDVKRSDQRLPVSVDMKSSDKTVISCARESLCAQSGDIIIDFSTPSLYVSLPGREPFTQQELSFFLEVLFPTSFICFVDYSHDISLRMRSDNSVYHSLAFAVEKDMVRKITFFEKQHIEVRWRFSPNNGSELFAPTIPVYAVAASLLAAGYTLSLVQVNMLDIASAMFAFALFPPFAQLFTQRRLYFPSSDISRLSWNDGAFYIASCAYTPLIVATCLALIRYTQYIDIISMLDFVTGVTLLFIVSLYVVLVRTGLLQEYRCDRCCRRIWIRRSAFLELETRRTLCRNCLVQLKTLSTVSNEKF